MYMFTYIFICVCLASQLAQLKDILSETPTHPNDLKSKSKYAYNNKRFPILLLIFGCFRSEKAEQSKTILKKTYYYNLIFISFCFFSDLFAFQRSYHCVEQTGWPASWPNTMIFSPKN